MPTVFRRAERRNGRSRTLLLILVALVTFGLPNVAQAANTDTLVAIPGNVSPLVSGSHIAPAIAPAADQTISISVGLAPRNADALAAYGLNAATPSNALYGKFLSQDEFLQLYAPARSDAEAVAAYLRSAGMTDIAIDDSLLSVTAATTVSQASAAFHTRMSYFNRGDGTVRYGNLDAPQLPARLAAKVQGIVGINNLDTITPRNHRVAGYSTTADGAGVKQPSLIQGPGASSYMTAPQMQLAYRADQLHTAGITGKGQRVGVVTLADFYPKDIEKFAKSYPTAFPSGKANVKRILVKTGKDVITFAGYDETTLDIESELTMAPDAAISVYIGANGDDSKAPGDVGFQQAFQKAVNDGIPVVSASWGSCELEVAPAVNTVYHTIFMMAATKGTTILNSSGDSGFAECGAYPGDTNPINTGTPFVSVSAPASDPYVLAIGGTNLFTVRDTSGSSRIDHEEGWTCTTAAGVVSPEPADCNRYTSKATGGDGGGVSQVWPRPSYQTGIAKPTTADPTLPQPASDGRLLPDISMDGGPFSPFFIGITDTTFTPAKYEYVAFYGTSLASPLMAGTLTLDANYRAVAAKKGGKAEGRFGLLQPTLYASASTTPFFADITQGDNGYAAGPGWDAATGLGGVGANGAIGADAFVYALPTALASGTADKLLLNLANPVYRGLVLPYGAFGTGSAIKFSESQSNGVLAGATIRLYLYANTLSGTPIALTCGTSADASKWLVIADKTGANLCPSDPTKASVFVPNRAVLYFYPFGTDGKLTKGTYTTTLTLTATTTATTPATFTAAVPISYTVTP